MLLPQQYRKYLPYFPAIVAAALTVPVLRFPYMWDDYNFLTNAVFYQLHDWVPDPTDPFYRPISRGVYFTLLSLAGRDGAALGHFLNLSFLVAIVVLLGAFAARLAGRSVGVLTSLLFALLGAAPALVAWVCCDQDLLAMMFIVVALHLRLSGRSGWALAATLAALLCKETALAVIPAIALFDWILGRRPYRIGRSVATYGLLIAAWGAIHPAVRVLVGRGLRSGATGYVGLEHPERWPRHAARYFLTLFNVPAYLPTPSWPVFGVLLVLVAGVLSYVILKLLHQEERPSAEEGRFATRRLVLLGSLLTLGPLVLTSTMVKGWGIYYGVFPAIGSSIIAAIALDRLRERHQLIALGIFLVLGMWTRGDLKDPEDTAEGNFRLVSRALTTVEEGFRRLYPAFPPNARVMLSVQAGGRGSIYVHMYAFQVLRIWYGDRSLQTIRPEARTSTTDPEVLAVIAPDWDVIDINPATLRARSASHREPEYHVCETAVRAYAMGLAGSGATSDAAAVLLHMPEINPGLASVHRRMAAMFLLAENRRVEARTILDSTVVLPRGIAIADLQAVLAEQPPNREFDEVALPAFGIDPSDTEAARELMRWFTNNRYLEVGLRFTRRVQKLAPGDQEAIATERKVLRLLEERKKAAPPIAAGV